MTTKTDSVEDLIRRGAALARARYQRKKERLISAYEKVFAELETTIRHLSARLRDAERREEQYRREADALSRSRIEGQPPDSGPTCASDAPQSPSPEPTPEVLPTILVDWPGEGGFASDGAARRISMFRGLIGSVFRANISSTLSDCDAPAVALVCSMSSADEKAASARVAELSTMLGGNRVFLCNFAFDVWRGARDIAMSERGVADVLGLINALLPPTARLPSEQLATFVDLAVPDFISLAGLRKSATYQFSQAPPTFARAPEPPRFVPSGITLHMVTHDGAVELAVYYSNEYFATKPAASLSAWLGGLFSLRWAQRGDGARHAAYIMCVTEATLTSSSCDRDAIVCVCGAIEQNRIRDWMAPHDIPCFQSDVAGLTKLAKRVNESLPEQYRVRDIDAKIRHTVSHCVFRMLGLRP